MQFDYLRPGDEFLSRRTRRARLQQYRKLGVGNPVMLKQNLTTLTSRGPGDGQLWADCPWDEISKGQLGGQSFFDDFVMTGNVSMSGGAVAGSIGQWSCYGYTGAQVNDGQLEGGVAILSADGDQEGLALLSSTGSFRMVTTSTLALNQKLWFECRIARSTVTTAKSEFFVGLMAPTLSSGLPAAAQPITTTDDTLMTAGDFFGFHCCSSTGTRGGMTEVAVAFCLASGTVNYPTNLTTLMASTGNTVLAGGTFVRLGFLFDPNAQFARITSPTARQTTGTVRQKLIRFFVNNIEAPTFLTKDDVQNATATQAFPTAFMAPVVAHMNTTGSTPGTTSIDWIKVAQMGNS